MRSREDTHLTVLPTRAHAPARTTVSSARSGGSAEAIREAALAGRSVVVLGEAGIGKTHLVNAALREEPLRSRVVNLVPVASGDGSRSLAHLLSDATLTDPDAAADELHQWATSRSQDERVVLRLENAQTVDEESLEVVRRLARRPQVTLVATSRAEPSRTLLFGDLPDLTRFTVRPLDTSGVETLLVELLGGFPTADTVHRLWVATRGNPFYLCELVRDQHARGALAEDDGIWVWTGTPTLTPRLVDSTLHELTSLGADERDVVELAAIVGPVPTDAIAPPTLDRLLRLGLLRPTPTPTGVSVPLRYEIAHPLQADAVCALVGMLRRRELLARAAGWQPHDDAGIEDLVRSVTRNLGAQVDVPVADLVQVSGHVVRSDDPYAAVELTSAALQRATAGLDRVAILTARADARLHLNDTDTALEDLAQARTVLERLAADGESIFDAYVRTVRLEAMVRHFLGCDLHSTLAMLDRSTTWLRTAARPGSDARRTVDALEGLRLAHVAWGGRHSAMLEDGVRMLRETTRPEDLAPLVGPTAFALTLAGRPMDAEQLNEQFFPVIAEHPALHRWEPGAFTLIRFFTLVLSGEPARAETTTPIGSVVDQVSRHQRAGVLATARGRWSAARHELRAANARLRRRDSLGVLDYTLAVEAMVAAAAGDAVGARALLDELRATPRRCSLVTGAYLDLHAPDALVWLRDGGAVAAATRLARAAARHGQCAIELEALHRVAVVAGVRAAREVAAPELLEDRVAWLAERVQGRRNSAVAEHLRALVTGRGAAEAAAALPEVGVHVPTPASPTRLTRREREIATFAAGGMTSKEIAARLVLSVRTVDSHLAGAYAKLGVHSREGLQDALAGTP